MDKRIVTFGRSGQFGSGHLSHFPGSVRKNPGLAGIVQPYQIYVKDSSRAGPYEERTHLSTDNQDPTKFSSTLKSTHYIKEGNQESDNHHLSKTKGGGSSEKTPCQCKEEKNSDSSSSSTNTSDIINEASKSPVKISQVEFKRKTSHLQKEGGPPMKKKRTINLTLYKIYVIYCIYFFM